MPLCLYFVAGNCRFGSKCNNDHIDLKVLLKTEVDSLVNGKQWLLSCMGPFKESVCIDNFITDQSFEEIRWGFMESSKNGTVQQFVANFMNEYSNALNKLNELKMLSPETIQLISEIYNTSTEQKSSTNLQSSVKPSPFGSSTNSVTATQQNIFGSSTQSTAAFGSSMFGAGNQQPAAAMNTTSIFGGSTNTINPFQAVPQQSSATSIFGGSSNEQKSSFSMSQPGITKPSIFGQQSSIFGGSQMQQQAPQTPSTNIFSQPASAFGQNPFSNPVIAPASTSIFGGTSVPQQAVIPQQAVMPSVFSSSFAQSPVAPMQQTSIFGSSNVFQSVPQQPPASNIFASPMSSQQVVPPVQSSQNIFGVTQNVQQQPISLPSSVFSIQQTQPQPQAMSSSVFNVNPPSSSNSNPFQAQKPATVDESAYTKQEELTMEELQAFQAANFALGRIPLKPPPQSLCI